MSARMNRFCSYEGCPRPVVARGLCHRHYMAWWRAHPNATDARYKPSTTCAIEGCKTEATGRGWCHKHYTRWLRHGDPLKVFPDTHGHTRSGRSPTYKTWMSMRDRCSRPGCNGYEYYGGRGISVCDCWQIFENFLTDMGERPEGKTLDRIDPNGNYEPGNCRWATTREQRANRREPAAA